MGLTIHYSLSLPTTTPVSTIKQKMGALRQACLDLPFQEVGELSEYQGEQCNIEKRDREDPVRWFLCQADTSVVFKYHHSGKPIAVTNWKDGGYGINVLPKHVIGFSTWPGNGCEEANVGLCRFPKTVSVPNRWSGKNHRLKIEEGGKWSWQSFCKTQYANEGGLESFLRCHLSVIAMLDAAKRIGFEVEVNDEGGYWQKRDVPALVQEIGEWDQLIAGFAGALKDAADVSGMTIEAPITDRQDFERLEAEGQRALPPGLGQVVRSLVATTANVPSKTGELNH